MIVLKLVFLQDWQAPLEPQFRVERRDGDRPRRC